MTRALIAARKSTKVRDTDGTMRAGESLDTQDELSREFCERLGWEVAGAPQDTISGRVAPVDRKQLGKWLNDPAKLATFDVIVAYKSDRYSRGEDTDWSRIEAWAADNGKTLVMADTATGVRYPARDDSDFWQWTAAKRQAAREWHDGRERSVREQNKIRANGKLVGRAPFGYKIAGERYAKELVIESPGRGDLIAGIFERVTAGDSLESVAQRVRDHGYPMYARTIGTLIRNTVYMGSRRDGYQAPAIVDATTWRNAGLVLDGKGKPHTAGSATPKAMLASVVRCGVCGSPMYRDNSTSKKTGVRYPYSYRCAGDYGADRTRKGKGCGSKISLAKLDALVSAEMTASGRRITEVRPRLATTTRIELDTLKVERKQLDDDADDYDTRHAGLTGRIKHLQAALSAESDASPFEVVELPETYAQRWNSLSEADRGAWLRKSGVRIYARPAGEAEHWTIDASDERVTWPAGDAEISLLICGSLAA